ncbi:MAG: orotate phosphoribosyltransferase [Bacteroidales bacterium]|nr:orotate phosphoribosyltransferase [Bacteroidales bacterium]
MKYNEEIALKISEYLLQIKAIKLNNNNPFIWASGLKSPIYCDNRITLSYPKIRNYIRHEFVKIINEEFGDADVIAGVATGGIAQGALVAQELGLPFVYIRSSKKSHGMSNQIEGYIESGQSVIVIEDLISTGKSSLNAVSALRDAGCRVMGMLAIFSYNLDIAKENFKKSEVPLFTLSDYENLIKKAVEDNYVSDEDVYSLIKWRENPKKWGEK